MWIGRGVFGGVFLDNREIASIGNNARELFQLVKLIHKVLIPFLILILIVILILFRRWARARLRLGLGRAHLSTVLIWETRAGPNDDFVETDQGPLDD